MPKRKLTIEDEKYIRNSYLSKKELALMFKVSNTTILRYRSEDYRTEERKKIWAYNNKKEKFHKICVVCHESTKKHKRCSSCTSLIHPKEEETLCTYCFGVLSVV